MKLHLVVKAVLTLAATVAFVAFVATTMDMATLFASMRTSDGRWLAAGIAAAVATTLLRAIRLSVLVDDCLDRRVVSASIAHNALTALLPMKLGEFALPLLLSRLGRMPVSGGLGVLILLRAFDLLAMVMIGSVGAYLSLRATGHVQSARFALAAAVGSVACAGLLHWGWDRTAGKLREAPLVERVRPLKNMLTAVIGTPRPVALRCVGLSLLIWTALYSAFYFFCTAVGLAVSPAMAAAVGLAASLAFAFPISGMANVGPFQAAWVWMAVQLGLPAMAALAASLVAHGAVVLTTVALAVVTAPLLPVLAQRPQKTGATPSRTPRP